MIWTAEARSTRPFGAPGRAEVSIDGSALTVRRGTTSRTFTLGTPEVEVTRHSWRMDMGTIVVMRRGGDRVEIGGRGTAFPDLPYELETIDEPELAMEGPVFEELHAAIMRALPALPVRAPGAGRFLLWKVAEGAWATVVVPFAVMVAGGASTLLPVPLALHIAVALALVVIAGWLMARADRAARRPALAVTIAGDAVMVQRLRPAVSMLASGTLASARVEHGHWSGRYGPIDNPLVVLSVTAGRRLAIGSPRPWAETRGRWRRRPAYLMAAPWWPAFIAALDRQRTR